MSSYLELLEKVNRDYPSGPLGNNHHHGGDCDSDHECDEACEADDPPVLGEEDYEGEVLSLHKDDPTYHVQRCRLDEEEVAEIEEQLFKLRDNPRFCGLVRMLMEGYRNTTIQVDASSHKFEVDDTELDPTELLFDEIREAMEEQVDKVGSNEGLRLFQQAYGESTSYGTTKYG